MFFLKSPTLFLGLFPPPLLSLTHTSLSLEWLRIHTWRRLRCRRRHHRVPSRFFILRPSPSPNPSSPHLRHTLISLSLARARNEIIVYTCALAIYRLVSLSLSFSLYISIFFFLSFSFLFFQNVRRIFFWPRQFRNLLLIVVPPRKLSAVRTRHGNATCPNTKSIHFRFSDFSFSLTPYVSLTHT